MDLLSNSKQKELLKTSWTFDPRLQFHNSDDSECVTGSEWRVDAGIIRNFYKSEEKSQVSSHQEIFSKKDYKKMFETLKLDVGGKYSYFNFTHQTSDVSLK